MTQPRALLLFSLLVEEGGESFEKRYLREVANELLRLYKVNEKLLETLTWIAEVNARDYEYQEKAQKALAKAKDKNM